MKQINTSKIEKKIKSKTKTRSVMPTFTCTCGAKILIVPDLNAMNKAIKNHIVEDKHVTEQFLSDQVIRALSKNSGL
jgi:hypothetical protein